MPNIATVLKEEIARLARKEIRNTVESLRKASAQYRSDIAELKRRLAVLEKQHSRLAKQGSSKVDPVEETAGTIRHRFSAKRFAAQRQKLGLSAADMGVLLGVSGQSIYHWEAGKTRPQQKQLAAIAALRKIGKRAAKARIATIKP